MEITGFPEVSVRVLSPQGEEAAANINNDSLVLRMTHGSRSFLFTGDIEKPVMRALLLRDPAALASDVLKVPHHGAAAGAVGNEFFHAVHPSVSLMSEGKMNRFHHPAPSTVESLRSIEGNHSFRTDGAGAIRVDSDGVKIGVFPMKVVEK
jgi:competence protein ComEC